MHLQTASALALGTEKARPLTHDHVFDRRRACVARFSLASVHAQARREPPRLPTRVAVTAKGSAIAANRRAQDHRRGRHDFLDLAARNAASPPRWPHARTE